MKYIEEIQKNPLVEFVDKKTNATIKRPYAPAELVAKFFKESSTKMAKKMYPKGEYNVS